MHLSGKVLDKLISQGVKISSREKDLVQLAGLLHDAGHTAFSHFFDYILEENEKNTLNKETKHELLHHEDRSIYILKRINQRKNLLTKNEEDKISKMIKGDISNEDKPFLFEIIKNKEFGLDVDRLDYLQRDMYYTSMPCFQSEYILECLRVQNNRLCLLKKSLPEIEMMYEARKRLLLIVCRHKTVIKIENTIRKLMEKLNIDYTWFEKNWLKLNDERMLNILEEASYEDIANLYERNWKETNTENRLEHIEIINRNEIEEQIKKVIWFSEE
jgi:HD superfamily phosphohydrolase